MPFVRGVYVPAHNEEEYDTDDKLGGTLTLMSEVFNVKAHPYGAKGDDTTEDSASIRACFAAAAAVAVTGKKVTVRFPEGVYKVAPSGLSHAVVPGELGAWFSTIGHTVMVSSNMRIEGPGTIHQTGVPALGDIAPWTNQYAVFAIGGGISNVVFDGLKFKGDDTPFVYFENNNAAGIMVYTSGVTTDVTVQNCTFQDLYGFTYHAVGSSISRINALNNTHINCSNGLNVNATYAQIRGNIFEGGEGIECSAAFTTIADNVFRGTKGPIGIGGDTSGAEMRGCVVTGNRIDTSDDSGIVIADGIRGAVISHNTITRCKVGGIGMTTSTGYPPSECVFIGNNIFGNNVTPGTDIQAVSLAGGGNHLFIGNHIWDDGSAGFYQQIAVSIHSSGCVVTGNMIRTTDRLGTTYAVNVDAGINATVFGNMGVPYTSRFGWVAGAHTPGSDERVAYNTTDHVLDIQPYTSSNGQNAFVYSLLASGKMEWGAPFVNRDTTLERLAANVLGLGANDALKTGAAVHASLPAAGGYQAGSQFYCTTDKQPLWSDGAVWVEADGTNH